MMRTELLALLRLRSVLAGGKQLRVQVVEEPPAIRRSSIIRIIRIIRIIIDELSRAIRGHMLQVSSLARSAPGSETSAVGVAFARRRERGAAIGPLEYEVSAALEQIIDKRQHQFLSRTPSSDSRFVCGAGNVHSFVAPDPRFVLPIWLSKRIILPGIARRGAGARRIACQTWTALTRCC